MGIQERCEFGRESERKKERKKERKREREREGDHMWGEYRSCCEEGEGSVESRA